MQHGSHKVVVLFVKSLGQIENLSPPSERKPKPCLNFTLRSTSTA